MHYDWEIAENQASRLGSSYSPVRTIEITPLSLLGYAKVFRSLVSLYINITFKAKTKNQINKSIWNTWQYMSQPHYLVIGLSMMRYLFYTIRFLVSTVLVVCYAEDPITNQFVMKGIYRLSFLFSLYHHQLLLLLSSQLLSVLAASTSPDFAHLICTWAYGIYPISLNTCIPQ